jgi:hypothetical protein
LTTASSMAANPVGLCAGSWRCWQNQRDYN